MNMSPIQKLEEQEEEEKERKTEEENSEEEEAKLPRLVVVCGTRERLN